MSIQVEVALCRRKDEGHRDDVHFLAGADQAADGEQDVVELSVARHLNGHFEVSSHRAAIAVGRWQLMECLHYRIGLLGIEWPIKLLLDDLVLVACLDLSSECGA